MPIHDDILDDIRQIQGELKKYSSSLSAWYIGKRTYKALQEPHFIPPGQIVDHYRRPRHMPRWKWYFLMWFDRFRTDLAKIKWKQDDMPQRYYKYGPAITDRESRELEKLCEPMYHGDR